MKRTIFDLCLVVVLALSATSAAAYIGPGSGISLLGGLWGVLVAIVLAIGAVLIWPIRYMFRRLRRKRGGAAAGPADAADAAETPDEVETSHSSGRSE